MNIKLSKYRRKINKYKGLIFTSLIIIFIIYVRFIYRGEVKASSGKITTRNMVEQRRSIGFQQTIVVKKATEAEIKFAEDVAKSDNPFKEIICSVFGDKCLQALKIQNCEDGRNDPSRIHHNTNGSIDLGLFQINSIHRERVEKEFGEAYEKAMTDPKKNIQFANEIYR